MKAKTLTERDLRTDELAFIKQHRILITEVIDVTGMISVGRKRAMEAHGARVAINGARCGNGHRLKTRSGHCAQCTPKYLAFERRFSTTAHVYVCVSGTGLVKIGYAKDPTDREGRLNREAYASCTNWRLVFSIPTKEAGRVEADAHASLSSCIVAHRYMKEGREIDTYECFRCAPERAIEAVKAAAKNIQS